MEIVVVDDVVHVHVEQRADGYRAGAPPRIDGNARLTQHPYPHHAVNIIRLPRRPTLHHPILPHTPRYQHLRLPPGKPLIPLTGNRTLQLLHAFLPLILERLRHTIVHVIRARAFLRRIREHTHPIKLNFLQEIQQRVEVVFRLAGKTHNHRRAHRQIRHRITIQSHLLANRALTFGTTHTRKHRVGAMLHGCVEVPHNARIRRNHIQ